MKRLVLLLTVSLALASCGASSKLKTSEESKEVKTLGVDLKENTTQKTTIKFDTVALIKGYVTKSDLDYSEFMRGIPLTTEDAKQKTVTYYNQKENKVKTEVTIKDLPVNISGSKVTETNTQTESKTDMKIETENKKTAKTKETKSLVPWWLWVAFLALVMFLVFIIKKYKKINSFLFMPVFLFAVVSCDKEDVNTDCNCINAVYENIYTHEKENYSNEPLDCDTQKPIEMVKKNVWAFKHCSTGVKY